MHGHATLRSTANEEFFSEELEFYQDKSFMPDPRQQDHRWWISDLQIFRSIGWGTEWCSFAISPTFLITNFCNINRINVVFPREIRINKNAQVFYVNFRLETNIFILSTIKHVKFWLVSKSLLVRTKNYKVGFIKVKS